VLSRAASSQGRSSNPNRLYARCDPGNPGELSTVIANHLGVDVKRVTDEAHFTDDLGADWLDRLELMIVIEDR
jgi:hypothetical protein